MISILAVLAAFGIAVVVIYKWLIRWIMRDK